VLLLAMIIQGFRVWYEQSPEGSPPISDSTAMELIECSGAFILFFSSGMAQSAIIHSQLRRALKLKKEIVMVHEEVRG
jgi:hypothetical protein